MKGQAQGLPAGTVESSSEPKRSRRGVWVGLAVVGVALLGAVGVRGLPARAPSPTVEPGAPAAGMPTPSAPVGAPGALGEAPSGNRAEAPPVDSAGAPGGEGTPADSQSSAPLEPPQAPKAGEGIPEAVGETPPQALAQEKGVLFIQATPYAIVLLDGRKLDEVQGRTRFTLAPGDYRVTFQHPAQPRDKVHRVTIKPGSTVTLHFRAPNLR